MDSIALVSAYLCVVQANGTIHVHWPLGERESHLVQIASFVEKVEEQWRKIVLGEVVYRLSKVVGSGLEKHSRIFFEVEPLAPNRHVETEVWNGILQASVVSVRIVCSVFCLRKKERKLFSTEATLAVDIHFDVWMSVGRYRPAESSSEWSGDGRSELDVLIYD